MRTTPTLSGPLRPARYIRLPDGLERRWHPGPALELEGAVERAEWTFYRYADGTASLDLDAFLATRAATVRFVRGLSPAIPRVLTTDCFDLARAVRELDMRAAPYDLRPLGYEPVEIETPDGKAAYVEAQRDFAARGNVLRRRLIEACDTLLPAPW